MHGERAYQRLLVANRGEIATRIIETARELGLTTFSLYTDNDFGHTYNASHALRLSSPAAYNDVEEILSIAKEHDIQAIHPGYGYLSESDVFAKRAQDAGILVIGPGHVTLARTGDKLQARRLAQECDVPVLPALTTPTDSLETIYGFAKQHGLPIMVKAVDGGGGRGIRLIRRLEDLHTLTARAIQESPSNQVFAERAAVDGFRHVEVQILGDGTGDVIHLWDRECSIQRRFQKVVEIAPSTVSREVVKQVIDAAVRMARKIQYRSLGTFEFLLNPISSTFYFLEVNPRLQVEHTITESICSLDIVELQLRLSMGDSLDQIGLSALTQDALHPPQLYAIQLRLTAENPGRDWTLSSGKITSFRWPHGNGVRVDAALVSGVPYEVGTSFDSVFAKIIITSKTWQATVHKARRAIDDTLVVGVNTNIDILRAILATEDFAQGKCDTRWLEVNQQALIESSKALATGRADPLHGLAAKNDIDSAPIAFSSSSTLFRREDAWSVSLTPTSDGSSGPQDHHLRLLKVLKNDFPASLRAQVTWTSPASDPQDYLLDLKATTASATAIGAQHRRGNPKDKSHVIIPFAGKLIEISVEQGDTVKMGDCIAVVQQMKMELEVRAATDGTITWLCDIADGEDVAEGVLAAIIEDDAMTKPKL